MREWEFRCCRRRWSAPMCVRQHLARPQALSAGAHAGAAVPLQPRLRRLRQDRLSGRDPEPAHLGRGCAAGGRRMRRAGGVDRRRRAAAAQGAAADRQGHHRAAQVRLSLHQRAADGEEARPISSRARSSSGRSISTATRRCTTARSARQGVYDRAVAAIQAAKATRLPRQHQLHALQQRRCRAAWRAFFDTLPGARRRRHHGVARLCL